MGKISAIDIKKLWYTDCISKPLIPKASSSATGKQGLDALLTSAKEIENVHQDTWQIEEGEASQDSYRNQLNGHVYRLGRKQDGDLTVQFTVGQYDYATKAALMGGNMLDEDGEVTTTASEAVGWERAKDSIEMYKTLIALTVDDVYVVISRASLNAREANTDKAIGLAMSGMMTDPTVTGVSSEYWYDKSAVDTTQVG